MDPTADLADARRRLLDLSIRDERRLRPRLDRLAGGGGPRRGRDRTPDSIERVLTDLEQAERAITQRRATVPRITYPDLPITARRDDLLAALRDHQVVVVAGETGSGKSTQLPKLLLEAGRGVRGMIGHTQPRRVAARTVAERIAQEMGTEIGGTVGYTVRFTDRVSDRTLVKVMTDGILLAETQRDRRLDRYDALIVDEAHERSLNVDFLLGYLTGLLKQRRDLQLVVTSATIDTERFSEHFGGAPVIQVEGRTHPVEVRYRPLGEDDDGDQVQAICEAVTELTHEGIGDILVFLSGEREIHDTADALRQLDLRHTAVLPLYARLPSAEQHRIFEPHQGRHVVLATNVAETSITVPGVRYVVDAGTARISRYNRRLKVQRLPIEPVSRASADQRAGRCGRVGPGIAIRLYAEDDYANRSEFTEPEMLRTNLASVILQMSALGLGDVAAFPFVDPPDNRAIRDGVALLEELRAFDPDIEDPRKRLTPLGRRLAQLPIDPRLGRMVLEADRLGCVREVLIIASALSIQDPRERPADKQPQWSEAHKRFVDDSGDFLAFVKLWDHLRAKQQELSSNQFRRLCRSEFLNYVRVREWQDLYSQLRQVASQLDIHLGPGTAKSHPDSVHQALLSGLLSQIGLRDEREGAKERVRSVEFRGARNARFAIGSGSSLARKPPRWVMAGELVETNRLWARVVARVQPEWAEQLGEHLVKRTWGEPTWDAERGTASAVERATLYGLPVVAGRRVDLARLDPELARELFIRHALVDGEWDTHHAFWLANRQLVENLREQERRTRRTDLLVDHQDLFERYDDLVPEHVVSVRHFDKWWKAERERRPELLTFTAAMLTRRRAPQDLDPHDFPSTWTHGSLVLPVSYVFEPGAPDDGVTVLIPAAVLNQVSDDGFDWQVPGRRLEVVTALIRQLPKVTRRQLVPAAEHAERALDALGPTSGSLAETLAPVLARMAAAPVSPRDLDPAALPPELRVTFAGVDADGAVLATSKDLAELRSRLRAHTRAAITAIAPALPRTGATDWAFGTIPPVVSGDGAHGYPALVDEGSTVGLRILTDPDLQARSNRAGVRRLLLLGSSPSVRGMRAQVPKAATLAMARLGLPGADALADDCVQAAVDYLVTSHGPVWDEAGFAALSARANASLPKLAPAALGQAADIVVSAASLAARLDRLEAPTRLVSLRDGRDQLARLVRPGFVTAAGLARLTDVIRYLQALERRLEKLPSDPRRDQGLTAMHQGLEARYVGLLEHLGDRPVPEEVIELGWLLEELRVSTFAQNLGTSRPVSEARLGRELDRLGAPA